MNILITGGTGFIGSHLVEELINHQHQLILTSRKKSSLGRISHLLKKLILYNVDSLNCLEKIFIDNRIDLIIHLATNYIKYPKNINEIAEMNRTDIDLPARLLFLSHKYKVRSFLNTGTCFEYQLPLKLVTENSPIRAYNYYAGTKIAFEEILKSFISNDNFKAITLKLFFPFGEKDNHKVIPLIINSFIKNQTLLLTKGGQRLNFTYIKDIISSYLKAIDLLDSPKYCGYQVFNIGEKKAFSLVEIVDMIRKISQKKGKIEFGAVPYPPNQIRYASCNYSKAKRLLKWQPETDIVYGLRNTYNYYLNNPM